MRGIGDGTMARVDFTATNTEGPGVYRVEAYLRAAGRERTSIPSRTRSTFDQANTGGFLSAMPSASIARASAKLDVERVRRAQRWLHHPPAFVTLTENDATDSHHGKLSRYGGLHLLIRDDVAGTVRLDSRLDLVVEEVLRGPNKADEIGTPLDRVTPTAQESQRCAASDPMRGRRGRRSLRRQCFGPAPRPSDLPAALDQDGLHQVVVARSIRNPCCRTA